MLSLLLVICCSTIVFSKSNNHEKLEARAGVNCMRNYLEYNLCEIPADNPKDVTGSIMTEYNENELEEIRKISRDEIINIKMLKKKVAKKIRCKLQLQKLKQKQLEDLVQIRTLTNEKYFQNISSAVTKSYVDITRVMWMLKHLETSLLLSVKNCCLKYPSATFGRLKNRLLMKWFYIQRDFGENIDVTKCDVNIEIEIKEPMDCDNTRDMIYLLLEYTMDIIKQSTHNIPGQW